MGNKLEAGTLAVGSLSSHREGKRREKRRVVYSEIEKGREKRRRKEEKEVHSSGAKPSVYLLPTALSFLFLHFVSFFSSLSLFLSPLSNPSPTPIRSQERVDRVAHTLATPRLERSRASSSAPPFTPRCSLENPTLFGSFDQSPPANYGLVMYRLLLPRVSVHLFSMSPRVVHSSSFLFLPHLFFFFFISPSLIRSKIRSCTRFAVALNLSRPEILFHLRMPSSFSYSSSSSLYGYFIVLLHRCSTLARGFPRSCVRSFSLAFGTHDCSSLDPLHFRLLLTPSTSTAS